MLCYPMICPLRNFFHVISLQNSAPVLTPEILKVRSVTAQYIDMNWQAKRGHGPS